MSGDLVTAAGRGDLVRLALRLIVEEHSRAKWRMCLAADAYRARRWGEGRLPQWLSAGSR